MAKLSDQQCSLAAEEAVYIMGFEGWHGVPPMAVQKPFSTPECAARSM
jgi:hypothetical protein